MAFPVKRSKVAKRNETNERIKLFEHSQASSVCLSKADYNSDFTGIFQNWTIKCSSILDIPWRVIFFKYMKQKWGVTTLVLVQSWYNGMEKVNIHFKMHVSNVLSVP